ncbi:MAG: type II toxin-antitoxin system HicB family antitoxin [Solirubrobacterales bacterium]|nr:type II toxin-antitoxin system HicB family antitoxin [Solirubrobacterales bacterium]
MTEYVVIYEQASDGGWGAYSPDLPGAVSAGDTREEVERNMREAIRLHLSDLRDRGRPMPKPSNFAGTVSV